jgi:hypothetical protein
MVAIEFRLSYIATTMSGLIAATEQTVSGAARREKAMKLRPSRRRDYFSDMGYYEPQERRTQQISARVPKSVKDGVARLSKLWTKMERLRTGDKEVEVTETDVIVRLLSVGLDGAWAEMGGEPKTDRELDELVEKASQALTATPAAKK